MKHVLEHNRTINWKDILLKPRWSQDTESDQDLGLSLHTMWVLKDVPLCFALVRSAVPHIVPLKWDSSCPRVGSGPRLFGPWSWRCCCCCWICESRAPSRSSAWSWRGSRRGRGWRRSWRRWEWPGRSTGWCCFRGWCESGWQCLLWRRAASIEWTPTRWSPPWGWPCARTCAAWSGPLEHWRTSPGRE